MQVLMSVGFWKGFSQCCLLHAVIFLLVAMQHWINDETSF